MALKTIYEAKVEYLQILDEQGNLDEELARDTLSNDDVLILYQQMIICRTFDEAAFKLQRSGRMGTFPQNKGHEAATLGAARALRKGVDYIVPYYRDYPALFLHGLPMHHVLQTWMGDERGNAIGKQYSMSPICVAIGAQTLHAVGIAWAFKMQQVDRAVLCFFGDGATSTGDFHAAMNLAALKKLPLVFSCLNNGWAISVPCCQQTAAETFAQKAIAYGMPTIQVDGNDIFAVYKAHRDAMTRAKAVEGPTFVESLTYRLGDHTTADDANRYRPLEQLETAVLKDPVIRIRKYLDARDLWDDEKQTKLETRATAVVHDVIEAASNIEAPSPENVFDFTFAELPADLEKQKTTMQTHSIGEDPNQVGLKEKNNRMAEHSVA